MKINPTAASGLPRYGLYPLLLGFTLLYLWMELRAPRAHLGTYYGIYLAVLVTSMVAIEALHPMRREWGMTAASLFRRDLPYLAITAVTIMLRARPPHGCCARPASNAAARMPGCP